MRSILSSLPASSRAIDRYLYPSSAAKWRLLLKQSSWTLSVPCSSKPFNRQWHSISSHLHVTTCELQEAREVLFRFRLIPSPPSGKWTFHSFHYSTKLVYQSYICTVIIAPYTLLEFGVQHIGSVVEFHLLSYIYIFSPQVHRCPMWRAMSRGLCERICITYNTAKSRNIAQSTFKSVQWFNLNC